MGYRVIYDDDRGQKRKKRSFFIPLTAAAWLAFVMLVNSHWPEGQAVLRQLLLPDGAQKAGVAVQAFAQDLQLGEAFPAAWKGFIQEVGEHVGLALD